MLTFSLSLLPNTALPIGLTGEFVSGEMSSQSVVDISTEESCMEGIDMQADLTSAVLRSPSVLHPRLESTQEDDLYIISGDIPDKIVITPFPQRDI